MASWQQDTGLATGLPLSTNSLLASVILSQNFTQGPHPADTSPAPRPTNTRPHAPHAGLSPSLPLPSDHLFEVPSWVTTPSGPISQMSPSWLLSLKCKRHSHWSKRTRTCTPVPAGLLLTTKGDITVFAPSDPCTTWRTRWKAVCQQLLLRKKLGSMQTLVPLPKPPREEGRVCCSTPGM